MKKDYKLYNMIIPPFFLIGFMPWFWAVSIVGNFLIDSAVVLIVSIILFKRLDFKFYLKKVWIVYLLGFAADFIGILYYFILSTIGSELIYSHTAKQNTFAYNILNGMSSLLSTTSEPTTYTLVFIISGIVITAALIFIINLGVFHDLEKKQRLAFALSLAILTAPYTSLLRYSVIA